MGVELLVPGIEVGLVTRNLQPMLAFYRDVLGLPLQGELPFEGGSMQRLGVGNSVVKLVTLDTPPARDGLPGGRQAATGARYLTLVVKNLREAVAEIEAAGHRVAEPVAEFQPGLGFAFVEDPDGNHVELAGPL